MLQIGLTGGIGSGKTTVARIFGVLGVPVFQADDEAKALLDGDPNVRAAVSARFGERLYAGGKLDRAALAGIVFNDPAALASLNAIVHPAVRQAFGHWAGRQASPYVLMEAAILAETGGHAAFGQVVTVEAPEELRVRRVVRRDGVGEEDVRARVRNQGSEQERRAVAHHVIVNDDRQLVIPQVLAVHGALLDAARNA